MVNLKGIYKKILLSIRFATGVNGGGWGEAISFLNIIHRFRVVLRHNSICSDFFALKNSNYFGLNNVHTVRMRVRNVFFFVLNLGIIF